MTETFNMAVHAYLKNFRSVMLLIVLIALVNIYTTLKNGSTETGMSLAVIWEFLLYVTAIVVFHKSHLNLEIPGLFTAWSKSLPLWFLFYTILLMVIIIGGSLVILPLVTLPLFVTNQTLFTLISLVFMGLLALAVLGKFGTVFPAVVDEGNHSPRMASLRARGYFWQDAILMASGPGAIMLVLTALNFLLQGLNVPISAMGLSGQFSLVGVLIYSLINGASLFGSCWTAAILSRRYLTFEASQNNAANS